MTLADPGMVRYLEKRELTKQFMLAIVSRSRPDDLPDPDDVVDEAGGYAEAFLNWWLYARDITLSKVREFGFDGSALSGSPPQPAP